jgi:hypothetical protein
MQNGNSAYHCMLIDKKGNLEGNFFLSNWNYGTVLIKLLSVIFLTSFTLDLYDCDKI